MIVKSVFLKFFCMSISIKYEKYRRVDYPKYCFLCICFLLKRSFGQSAPFLRAWMPLNTALSDRLLKA